MVVVDGDEHCFPFILGRFEHASFGDPSSLRSSVSRKAQLTYEGPSALPRWSVHVAHSMTCHSRFVVGFSSAHQVIVAGEHSALRLFFPCS